MPDGPDAGELAGLYQDLHAHPELAFAEHRTAGIAARRLRDLGYQVTTGVGGTGVVGALVNGTGPTVLLRADMDGLPVREQTGLAYASTARATDSGGADVPVMHACGHDMHVTCLLGAAAELAGRRDEWRGTLLLVFQPAEETGQGARAMVDDGLYSRFPVPDIVLGQHVMPLPAGVLGLHGGPAMAGADALRVVLHGTGGHGSRPETTVDPVLMAAATVLRLQGVVSREVAAAETAVLTVGALRAGTASNIIPDQAELLLSLRSYNDEVRDALRSAVGRIARAEAAASGAPKDPEITTMVSFPVLVNDPGACARLTETFNAGVGLALDPGPVTGSEDVGLLATAAGVPCAYWFIGGSDPALFEGVTTIEQARGIVDGLPSNHSPLFAPVIEPTLSTGIAALVTAARTWLAAALPCPRRALAEGREDGLGLADQRGVDHLAVDLEHALVLRGGAARRGEHPARPGDLRLVWAEGRADHRRLGRVDARLAREPGGDRVPRLGGEAVEVADVHVDRVDGGLAVSRGGEQHRRPGVQRDVAVGPVGTPAGPAPHGGDQVLSAPQERDDVGRRGDLGRADHAAGSLAQRHHLPLAAKPVQLGAGLGLGEHDASVPGRLQGGQVRRVLGGAGRVDPDDDPGRVKVPRGQRRGERGPCRGLAARADRVLQVEDHRVRGGQCLRVALGPVGRAEQQRGAGQRRRLRRRHSPPPARRRRPEAPRRPGGSASACSW